ncbi:hypothetical protein [Leptospira idonii]|uniref:Uncharacterized protein n=1 Tax=Leptospira idonii TaxID=1193500 RepID=A0A4R9LX19_9LEPT|nr:hypothetical protein [Leptospira idonii]TGN17981.1 hypothetical protein EHS15_15720 [Leptospira idonii]
MNESEMKVWQEELAKTFFLSILQDLSQVEEHLSDFEVKQLILSGLKRIPDMEVEWGESDRFGKSTLLLKVKSNLLVIEATPLIHTIRILWNEYKSKNKETETA